VTDELCDLMKRSGCIGVSLGPDACSERVLAAYRKGIGMADVAEAVRLLRRHDIPFETCIILGGPGETRETVGESIEFCAENLADEVVRFYDGMVVTSMSGVYDIAVAEGLVDPDRRYEDIILENDFRAMKGYEYFFPHVQEGRDELLEFVDRGTQRPRWLLTSRDYKPDPGTGGLALVPEKAVSPGSRPWWRDLGRAGAPVSEGVGDA
jgi:hypothetical protein